MDINSMPEAGTGKEAADKKIVVGAALILIVLTGGSRILGLVREATVAAFFGAGAQTDSFFVAFSIPDFLFNSLSNFLIATSFIPIFCKCMGKKDAWEFTASVLAVLIFVLLLSIVFLEIFTVEIISVITPTMRKEQLSLTVDMTRIMAPIILAGALTGLAKGILNSFKIYTIPALTPIVYNVVIISTVLLFGAYLGIKALAFGVLVAAAAQFVIQVPGLLRSGINYLPKIDFRNKDLKVFIQTIIPVVLALSIGQIVPYFELFLASRISEGSISFLNYANRIFILPEQVVAAAITTAIFPFLSLDAAEHRTARMGDRIARSVRITFFAILPLSIFMASFSVPIIQTLLGRGEFREAAIVGTGNALAVYSLGLTAVCIRTLVTSAFFALKQTRTLLLATALMVPLNIIVDLELVKHFSYRGIALGMIMTATVHTAVLIAVLRKRIGALDWGPRGSLLKITANSFIMAALLFLAGNFFPGAGSVLHNLIFMGLVFGLGMSAYFALNLIAGVEEAGWVRDFVRNKWGIEAGGAS